MSTDLDAAVPASSFSLTLHMRNYRVIAAQSFSRKASDILFVGVSESMARMFQAILYFCPVFVLNGYLSYASRACSAP